MSNRSDLCGVALNSYNNINNINHKENAQNIGNYDNDITMMMFDSVVIKRSEELIR